MKDYTYSQYIPEGVPKTINPDEYSSLVDLLEQSFSKFADLVAYHHMGVEYTYAQIDEASKNFAAYLQNHTPLEKGDKMAIQMPNMMAYPIVLFGAMRAGIVVVNTNPLYTPREMKHQFTDAGVKAIVIVANFAFQLQKVIADTDIKNVIVTEIGDFMSFPKRQIVNFAIKYVKKMVPPYSLPQAVTLRDVLAKGKNSNFTPTKSDTQENAFIQYTGGTTGVSKGAELTHRNILANTAMMRAWINGILKDGKETIITALPMYHIFSLTVNTFSFVAFGAKNVLITNPRDMPGFIEELKKHQFTTLTGVNTLFNGLLNQPNFTTVDFKALKVVIGGAMAIQKAVAEKWLAATGCPIAEGYGLTECAPVVSCNPLDEKTARVGTIGLPLPSTQIKIVGEDGEEMPDGEPGELLVKGPQVMRGYWKRPEATAETITADGWLKTGDMAQYEGDGFFKIVDRKKDMILVSGFNVYPNEIEDVIAMMPGVLEVAAIGVPDEKSNEAVKVFIIRKDEHLTVADIKAHCKENLTGYKVPRHYDFRTDLPKSNVGKILRRTLKEEEAAK
jgi:long-chain acyl-CoA synthetase